MKIILGLRSFWAFAFISIISLNCKPNAESKSLGETNVVNIKSSAQEKQETENLTIAETINTSKQEPELNNALTLPDIEIKPVHYNVFKKGTGEEPGELFVVTYPKIKTSDRVSDSIINSTIHSDIKESFGFVLANPTKEHQKKIKVKESLEERPFENQLDYSVDYVSKYYVGISLIGYQIACCGASGSGHWCTGLVFDRNKQKFVYLKDIIKPQEARNFRNVILDLAKQDDQLTNSSLEELSSDENLLDNKFRLTKDGLGIIIQNTGGSWSSFIVVEINFNAHQNLFQEELLNIIREKTN